MGEDFDYMKKSREEWKKQLDARFQDIERYIYHHLEKYRAANSTSQTRQNEPTILYLLSSTNFSSRSKKQEKIFKQILIIFQNQLIKDSSKRIKKWQILIEDLRKKKRTETINSNKVRKTLNKKLIVKIYLSRNK